MALFGSSTKRRVPQQKQAPAAPMQQASAPRRGLFGRLMMNDGDATTPNLADWLLMGPNAPSVLQNRASAREDQAYLRDERSYQSQERERGLEQQVQTEAMLARLPEQQQLAARLDPDAFGRSLSDQVFPDEAEWRAGHGRAYRIEPDGSVSLGGRIPTAPQQAGVDSNAFQILSPQEVQQLGLARGSYQRNVRTGQVTPIGRQRAQYGEFAGQSAQFASRMAAANDTLRGLEDSLTDPAGVYAAQSGFGSQEERRVRQAQREFVNAILRRESGAAIGANEFESAAQQYFPQPGDGPEVIEQKRQARERSIQGLVNASQGAYEEWYGDGLDGQGGPPPRRNRPRSSNPDGARPGANSVRLRYNSATGRIE